MNREDIIKLAREAGLRIGPAGMGQTIWGSDEDLERFAALVAAAEREACADAAEQFLTRGRSPFGRSVAAAIRARGNT